MGIPYTRAPISWYHSSEQPVPTKFQHVVMSNQASNTQTGAPSSPQCASPPAPQGAPPQMMMGAPQPQYAPQRQAMVVTSGGGEPYCGPTTIMMGVVLCCFTGCGFWVALCPGQTT